MSRWTETCLHQVRLIRVLFVLLLGQAHACGHASDMALDQASLQLLSTIARPATGCVEVARRAAIAENPMLYEAGKEAFFDKRFSSGAKVSCASCHVPQLAWSDAKSLAKGIGSVGRNSPSLLNIRERHWLTWDGRFVSLAAQAKKPLFAPNEMHASTTLVRTVVRQTPVYSKAYKEWTGPNKSEVEWLTNALSHFQRTIVSCGAHIDRLADAVRNSGTLPPDAPPKVVAGLRLFVGKAQCVVCHSGPNLTDESFHSVRLLPLTPSMPLDSGRYGVLDSFRKSPQSFAAGEAQALARVKSEGTLWGRFRTPSLRNAALSGPYMHQGQLRTLEDVIDHYSELSNAAPAGHHEDVPLLPLHLTSSEKQELRAFLHALTDKEVPCASMQAKQMQIISCSN